VEKTVTIFKKTWLKASILLICFIGAYWIPLKAMVSIWSENEDYSYGFLIPVTSGYFLWENRKSLKDIPVNSSWTVLPILVFFVLLSMYGTLGSSGNISMFAIPILILLFVSFCFGIAAVKRLILPLGFLVFMVPVPSIIERYIGLHLKAIASVAGGAIIRFFNIPVNVYGNVIDLGITQLQVVDACSGMRYVFALLALGVIYAYFFEKVTWKRVVTVLSTIPISILINALRIGIAGILTDKYGVKMAEGFFHGFSGWALFLVAFAFLFLMGKVLSLFPPQNAFKAPLNVDEHALPTPMETVYGNMNKAFLVSVALLLVVGLLSLSTTVLPAVKIRGGLVAFPLEFSGWRGQFQLVDPEIVVESGAEESFSGFYAKGDRDSVSLYLGYRSTAFLANKNFFHSPTACLPSSGWNVLDESTHVITNVPFWGDVTVAKMVVENLGNKELVYFWFQTKDKTTPDKNINRLHLTFHSIRRDNTHDLFIRPIASVQIGESIEEAEKRMDQFVREMMQVLMSFLRERQYEE
jgi:exosortase D (VPLPA-CTERM-specific)